MPYTINGQPTELSEDPHVQNGAVYVPITPVIQALGGTISWDNDTKVATATIGQWVATFQLTSDTADVSGTTVQFSSPSYVDQGVLYVPADFFHNAYGYVVTANGEDVSISLP